MPTALPDHTTPARPDRPGARWLRPILWANLVAEMLIVVTGGIVRLTGSGLGCPSWPYCTPGSFTPTVEQAEGYHKLIEFGNRTLTGALLVIALAALWALHRWAPERPALRRWIWIVGIGIAVQAVIGGITVITGLHPTIVGIHYLVSAYLIWASAVLVWRERHGDDEPVDRAPLPLRRASLFTLLVGFVVLALGTVVTGTGPHAGDADEPVRYALDPRTISWLHADSVMLFVGCVIALIVGTKVAKWDLAARWWVALGLACLAQGVIGYVQYFNGLPEWLVVLHMLMSTVIVALATFGDEALTRRRTGRTPQATSPGAPAGS